MLKRILLIAAVAAALFSFGLDRQANASIVVLQGNQADAVHTMGVRFRSFQPTGGDEMYLGKPDLGQAGNRVSAQYNWGANNTIRTSTVKFSYDGANTITGIIDGANGIVTRTYNVANSPLNVMKITVAARDAGSKVQLNNATLNGNLLGNFQADQSSLPNFLDWTVYGFNFNQAWTFLAELRLEGSFGNSQELSRSEINVGYSQQIAAIPEPGTFAIWSLGAAAFGICGMRRRRNG